LFFSPEIKYKSVFLGPRIKYMTEVLRQLSCSYKRIVAIVDNDHLPVLEEEWQHLTPDIRKLNSLLNVPKNWNGNMGLNGKLDKFMK